jgi:hypothetical protein
MSKLLQWIGVLTIVVLIVMQFTTPAKINRRVNPSQTIEAVINVPPDITATLKRACWDCHSENTVWRWYSKVAPFSWLQMADVGMAREEVNLSRWSEYTQAQQGNKLKEMCEMVREGDMSLWYYKLLHLSSWLSEGDVNRICEWIQQERQRLASNPIKR